MLQVLQLMRHKDASLVPEVARDAVLKQVFADVGVHRGQWIVQQVDVRILVHRSATATIVDAMVKNSEQDFQYRVLFTLRFVFLFRYVETVYTQ